MMGRIILFIASLLLVVNLADPQLATAQSTSGRLVRTVTGRRLDFGQFSFRLSASARPGQSVTFTTAITPNSSSNNTRFFYRDYAIDDQDNCLSDRHVGALTGMPSSNRYTANKRFPSQPLLLTENHDIPFNGYRNQTVTESIQRQLSTDSAGRTCRFQLYVFGRYSFNRLGRVLEDFSDWWIAESALSVVVGSGPQAPTVDLKVNSSDGPVTVQAGQQYTVSHSSSNATAIVTTNTGSCASYSVTTPSGSETLTAPNFGTSCRYSATPRSGSTTGQSDSVTVTVQSSAPTLNFQISPSSVTSGQAFSLTWSTANATRIATTQRPSSCPVAGSLTPVASGSQTLISPSVSSPTVCSYSATASGPGGTTTRTVSVTVNPQTSGPTGGPPPAPAPTLNFTISPGEVNSGANYTLTWSSTNATSVTISIIGGPCLNVGNVGTSGSTARAGPNVTARTTCTYRAVASGSGGSSPAVDRSVVINPTVSSLGLGASASLSKSSDARSGDGGVLRGATVRFTLRYRIQTSSNGGGQTTSATLTDSLPSNVSFVSASGNCGGSSPSRSGQTLTWSTGQLCTNNTSQNIVLAAQVSSAAPCDARETNTARLVVTASQSGLSASDTSNANASIVYDCPASLDLKINGQNSGATGIPGEPFTLSWSSSRASSISVTVSNSNSSFPCPGAGATATPSGSRTLTPPLAPVTYTCTYSGTARGSGGEASDTVAILITPPNFKIKLRYDNRVNRRPPPGFALFLGSPTGERSP